MRGFLLAIWQQGASWLFFLVWIPLILVVSLVTLGRRKDTVGNAMVRGFGKGALWLSGVRVAIDPRARAELSQRRGRVLTFNHSSTLDLFVGASIQPEGAVTIVKREMLRVPLLGQAIRVLDMLPLDRENREGATHALAKAATRLREEQLSAIIAPEGTRARDGQLGPFKTGAFHLAIDAGVPIVPIVMHGCARLWPRGRKHCEPGTVRIEILDEISTQGLTAADVRALAERVRQRYIEAFARAAAGTLAGAPAGA